MVGQDGDDGDPLEPGEGDSWPDEPDEFDPASLGGNVEIPRAPDMTQTDASIDPAVERFFWKLVLVFNVAIFALSVGPMLIFFRGQWKLGGSLFALGAAAFVYGVVLYRRYRAGSLLDDADETESADREDTDDRNDYPSDSDRNG